MDVDGFMSEKVLFFSRQELNYIQTILDKYSVSHPEYKSVCWYIIKSIDSQAGGCYPRNYNW